MAKRVFVMLGVVGLIATGGLALFLVFTQSTYLFQQVGSTDGNPTGETFVVPNIHLKQNKIIVCVGTYLRYVDEEHEVGTFNLTRRGTGQVYSVSYDLGDQGTFQDMYWDGIVLDLPAGMYEISAENHHPGGGASNNVIWTVIQEGYLRFSGNVNGDIPDDPEGWMLFIVGFSTFMVGAVSIIAVQNGRKKDVDDLEGYSQSRKYSTTVSDKAYSAVWNSVLKIQPKTKKPEPTVSSTEPNLSDQAIITKVDSQPSIASYANILTKTCAGCGKSLPKNAKFCSSCGLKI